MGDKTNIGWTMRTWNPHIGCHKVSPACKNCYMFRDMERFGKDPTVVARTKTWNAPRKWQKALEGTNKTELVFTCSWSDFFIEEADEWRKEAWQVIKETPNLIYQVLTKRPENMATRMPEDWGEGYPNVALGVSVENKDYYWRIEELVKISARWHFISAEPLLGSVKDMPLDHIEWLITGGESGSNFRELELDWVRELREMCVTRNIPFFYKQDSGLMPGQNNDLDGQKWEQWPVEWLNV